MACERHDSMEVDLSRLRDDTADLYEKSRDNQSRIVALEEKIDRRASDIARLEAAINKLEGMITGLAAQITALQNAPAQKIAGRVDSVLEKLLWLAVSGGIGVLATLIVKGGKP